MMLTMMLMIMHGKDSDDDDDNDNDDDDDDGDNDDNNNNNDTDDNNNDEDGNNDNNNYVDGGDGDNDVNSHPRTLSVWCPFLFGRSDIPKYFFSVSRSSWQQLKKIEVHKILSSEFLGKILTIKKIEKGRGGGLVLSREGFGFSASVASV